MRRTLAAARSGLRPDAPTQLDPADLSVRAELPSAIEFQRRAAAMIDDLRRVAPSGAFRVRVDGYPLDALDILRFAVVRAAGRSLGFVGLLEAAALPPGRPAAMDLRVPMPEWEVALAATGHLPTGLADRARRALRVNRDRAFRLRTVVARARRAPRSTPARRADIDLLVLAELPNHVGDVGDLLRRLAAEHGYRVGFLVADERTGQAASAAGFEVLGGVDATAGDVVRVAAAARRVRRRVRRAAARLPAGPAHRAFAAAAADALADHLTLSLVFAASAARVLADAPDAVVLTPNPTSAAGRTGARLARLAGREVLGLEHGVVFADDPRWDDLPVTRMCVWGDTSRRALMSRGMPDATIAVTGAPRFDDQPAVADIGAPARAGEGAGSVLVATSGPGDHVSFDEHLRFVALLADAVAATPELRWVVKLHPKDRRAFYDHAAFRTANVEVVDGRGGGRDAIYDHLARSSCLVTVTSATAIDALRARVPVVAVRSGPAEPSPEFILRTAARIVTDPVQLASAAADAAAGRLEPPDLAYLDVHLSHRGEAVDRVHDEIAAARRRRRTVS